MWLKWLGRHEPVRQYRHSRTGEDNGASYLERPIMGRDIAITGSGFVHEKLSDGTLFRSVRREDPVRVIDRRSSRS